VNIINDQLDATITILLIFESAQHVSGNVLPIFRSVILWLQQCGVLSNVVVGWRSGVRQRRLCLVWGMLLVEQHPSHRTHSLRRWADSKINKIVIVESSWAFILFPYSVILIMGDVTCCAVRYTSIEKLFAFCLYTGNSAEFFRTAGGITPVLSLHSVVMLWIPRIMSLSCPPE
jgi:hypothetical protein